MLEYRITREREEDSFTAISYEMLLDGQAIGWAEVMTSEDDTYVERIDVDEAFRNNGYGTAFLNHLSSEYGEIFVAPDNEDAKRLYDRLGYEDDDHDYYDQGFGVYRI